MTMSKLISIILFCFLFAACSNNTSPSMNQISDSTSVYKPDSVSKQAVSFGDSILTTFIYPKKWDPDPKNYGRLLKSQENEFNSIAAFYANLMKGINITLPPIKRIEHVNIGEEKYCTCTDSIPMDSCRFKLSIGKYQCYYITSYIYSNESYLKKCNNNCTSFGKLLVYDQLTQTAKALSIYYEGNGEQNSSFRYFYISKEGTIQIYEGSCYDDGCSMKHSYSINLSETGEVKINQIK